MPYNDVLLVPRYSRVRSRDEVDLKTVITPGIALAVPLLSANMDSVTGIDMAIAMDRLGGIGVIGRFDTPEAQARTVQTVTDAGARCIGVIGVKDDALQRAELHERAEFVQITGAGYRESEAHDVLVRA